MAGQILHSSPYVPAEWIAAHGLEPHRLTPETTRGGGPIEPRAGVCPFMAAFVNQAVSEAGCAGVVLATTCDQFRRAADLLPITGGRPVFLMNVPATRQSTAARRLYADEVRRLGRYLESVGGRPPGEGALRSELIGHDVRRAEQRAVAAGARAAAAGAVPVAVIGGPMTRGQGRLFDLIGSMGGRVCVDGTEAGARMLAAPVDPDKAAEEPFEAMLDAYLGIPDVFQRPNDAFHAWLGRETAGVRGIVVVRQVWCDLWHAEVARIRDAASVPVLDIELHDDTLPARLRTRLEAFMEVIR